MNPLKSKRTEITDYRTLCLKHNIETVVCVYINICLNAQVNFEKATKQTL